MGSPPSCLLDIELLPLMEGESHKGGSVALVLAHKWCYMLTRSSRTPIVLTLDSPSGGSSPPVCHFPRKACHHTEVLGLCSTWIESVHLHHRLHCTHSKVPRVTSYHPQDKAEADRDACGFQPPGMEHPHVEVLGSHILSFEPAGQGHKTHCRGTKIPMTPRILEL